MNKFLWSWIKNCKFKYFFIISFVCLSEKILSFFFYFWLLTIQPNNFSVIFERFTVLVPLIQMNFRESWDFVFLIILIEIVSSIRIRIQSQYCHWLILRVADHWRTNIMKFVENIPQIVHKSSCRMRLKNT